MVVNSVDFALQLALERRSREGSHAILLHGNEIINFTPSSVNSVWLFTGMFVPPLLIDGSSAAIARGVSNDFWRRSCLWFFCPQLACHDILELLKSCEGKETSLVKVTSTRLRATPLEHSDSIYKFSKEPGPLVLDDDMTLAESKFLAHPSLDKIPRTLFHLSFWCVLFANALLSIYHPSQAN